MGDPARVDHENRYSGVTAATGAGVPIGFGTQLCPLDANKTRRRPVGGRGCCSIIRRLAAEARREQLAEEFLEFQLVAVHEERGGGVAHAQLC